jgi:2,4-dienoyl-CoA reductase-like NADH-dependent reductase (Old Yellow Enzyme family)
MHLFSPLRLRDPELKNRIVVSPMCECSAKEGHPQPWPFVHLGSRAVGAALVLAEASREGSGYEMKAPLQYERAW